jgi:hypothetical protein
MKTNQIIASFIMTGVLLTTGCAATNGMTNNANNVNRAVSTGNDATDYDNGTGYGGTTYQMDRSTGTRASYYNDANGYANNSDTVIAAESVDSNSIDRGANNIVNRTQTGIRANVNRNLTNRATDAVRITGENNSLNNNYNNAIRSNMNNNLNNTTRSNINNNAYNGTNTYNNTYNGVPSARTYTLDPNRQNTTVYNNGSTTDNRIANGNNGYYNNSAYNNGTLNNNSAYNNGILNNNSAYSNGILNNNSAYYNGTSVNAANPSNRTITTPLS